MVIRIVWLTEQYRILHIVIRFSKQDQEVVMLHLSKYIFLNDRNFNPSFYQSRVNQLDNCDKNSDVFN